MKREKIHLNGIMLVGVIIVVVFICGVEIQPVVTGDLNSYGYRLMGVQSNHSEM